MIYLFYGPDEFARTEALNAFRSQIPLELRPFNITHLDGRNLNIADFLLACQALPFLSDQRLVVVVDALKHQKSAQEHDWHLALERIPPTCTLVFLEQEDVDKRSALYRTLKHHAQIQEFLPRQGNELLRWLSEQATAKGCRLPRESARLLVEYVGSDSRMLMTELDKLVTYVGPGRSITETTITLLVQDYQQANLFAFLDSLSQRQREKALAQLRQLLEDGQALTYIVFMLARQVRILLNVKAMAAQGMRPDAIASELGQKPFVIRKALQQAERFETHELEALHHRLLDLDHANKTGKISTAAALDVLVLEVCG